MTIFKQKKITLVVPVKRNGILMAIAIDMVSIFILVIPVYLYHKQNVMLSNFLLLSHLKNSVLIVKVGLIFVQTN